MLHRSGCKVCYCVSSRMLVRQTQQYIYFRKLHSNEIRTIGTITYKRVKNSILEVILILDEFNLRFK